MQILPREYQQKIADKIIKSKKNTLIVLPTGLGKTLIGAIVVKYFIDSGGKAFFLAPTRPLVDQHTASFKEYFGKDADVFPLTGSIPQVKRKQIYREHEIIVATPQTLSNDLKRWDFLDNFSVIIFDEAHKSIGKYAYTHIAKIAKEKKILIVGLTASPGGKAEKIREIMESLFIDNIEIRTEKEKDVLKYVQPISVEWIYVDLTPEIKSATSILESLLDEKSETLKSFGIRISKKISRSRLSQIYRELVKHRNLPALGHFSVFYNAFHGLELLETEGPFAYQQFIERLKERKKRVHWKLIKAVNATSKLEHPKLDKLIEILKESNKKDKKEKIIIFTQYRDQVNHIVEIINNLKSENLLARRFLGKKEGSQKEQKQTIEDFRANKFDVLCCTSIGEEGIDIPAIDTAIFYEPIPSEIRTIQRRGRVGRTKGGNVIVLVTKDTRDEVFRWVSHAREKKMQKIVREMKSGKRKVKKIGERKEKTEKIQKEGKKGIQQTLKDFFS